MEETFNFKSAHQYELREFNELFAIDGDLYLYDRGKLVFVGNSTTAKAKHHSLRNKIRIYLWHKKNRVIRVDRRTLEFIYNVCKGAIPKNKEDFVKCVLGSMP